VRKGRKRVREHKENPRRVRVLHLGAVLSLSLSLFLSVSLSLISLSLSLCLSLFFSPFLSLSHFLSFEFVIAHFLTFSFKELVSGSVRKKEGEGASGKLQRGPWCYNLEPFSLSFSLSLSSLFSKKEKEMATQSHFFLLFLSLVL
jgi:hypothetical protein